MDDLTRAEGLRSNIAIAMERLYMMETGLEKADQEVMVLNSKIRFLEDVISRLKAPGIAVSLNEFTTVRQDLQKYLQRKKTIEIEAFNVRKAMFKIEHNLEIDQAELDHINRKRKTLTFRRNDE